jgi:hypothetical protein
VADHITLTDRRLFADIVKPSDPKWTQIKTEALAQEIIEHENIAAKAGSDPDYAELEDFDGGDDSIDHARTRLRARNLAERDKQTARQTEAGIFVALPACCPAGKPFQLPTPARRLSARKPVTGDLAGRRCFLSLRSRGSVQSKTSEWL